MSFPELLNDIKVSIYQDEEETHLNRHIPSEFGVKDSNWISISCLNTTGLACS